MRGFGYRWGVVAALLTVVGSSAAAVRAQVAVRINGSDHPSRKMPLSVVIPESRLKKAGMVASSGNTRLFEVPCQVEPAGDGKVRLTFLAEDLPQGISAVYVLKPATTPGTSGVEMKRTGENVDILIGGKLFTRYDTTTGPNKPYFYPLNLPAGPQLVRHWPVEKNVAGETHDHPHHRGLWFTHSSLNGVDFWTETANKTGKTVATGYETIEGGPVCGVLRTGADWIMPDGKKIATDKREFRFYPVPGSGDVLMDVTVAVTAVGGPLTWGDEKDGVIGLRVADSMRVDAKQGGKIELSTGATDAAAWGKTADWCVYSGPVEGDTYSIAILDNPANLRHPTPWHVRTYGLFAANPFGLHDFDPSKKNDKHAGDYVTPEGQTLTFRYRLIFHKGDAGSANLPAQWQAYADPPAVALVEMQEKKR